MSKRDAPLSKRYLRVSEALKRTISEAFNVSKILVHVIGDVHITVSEVRLSSDLKSSVIYILPENTTGDVLEIVSLVNEYSWELKKYLSKETNLKFLPKLKFKYDDLFDKIESIDKVLGSVEE